jgi:hypothetical protein
VSADTCDTWDTRDTGHDRDAGVVGAVEVLILATACVVVVVFLGYLGRLHAAGVEVSNVSQSAARAASLEPDRARASSKAEAVVRSSPLARRCRGGPRTSLDASPSPTGSWQGGTVRVVVSCTVDHSSLGGIWAPGSRTISASDRQPIDRYTR